jgi:hypothetical protein
MAAESEFVGLALEVAKKILPSPRYVVSRGAALLYQVTVDNKLALTVNIQKPTKGNSAFQTDLCVFEVIDDQITIPRVVLEFKTKVTTHDILTYSAKATKHKQVYPYLRYGMIASGEEAVPGRLFTHNQSLDFFAAVKDLRQTELRTFLSGLLTAEIEASKKLEAVTFNNHKTRLFRTEIEA